MAYNTTGIGDLLGTEHFLVRALLARLGYGAASNSFSPNWDQQNFYFLAIFSAKALNAHTAKSPQFQSRASRPILLQT